jgi:hypothetical protein
MWKFCIIFFLGINISCFGIIFGIVLDFGNYLEGYPECTLEPRIKFIFQILKKKS